MAKVYYACCDANGLISKRLEATDALSAAFEFRSKSAEETREWIDGCSTDLEDDSDVDGTNRPFEAVLSEAGAEFEFKDSDIQGDWAIYSLPDYTLREFRREAGAGVVTNDRGNGCGGPGYLPEGEPCPSDRSPVSLVTEEEDADAWRLAREAMAARNIPSEPVFVAVGERSTSDPSAHQMIYAG